MNWVAIPAGFFASAAAGFLDAMATLLDFSMDGAGEGILSRGSAWFEKVKIKSLSV
tara:strand:+ start:377 stop:544 length:168 start_codon:yes stop_codon:yes gene_type:complete